MPKPYPQESREDVVRVARNRSPGVTVEQVAADFGVHAMTLWKRMCRADIDDGTKPGTTSHLDPLDAGGRPGRTSLGVACRQVRATSTGLPDHHALAALDADRRFRHQQVLGGAGITDRFRMISGVGGGR